MSNPYDNNPYNRNQGGNMNNNPYGNRPQNMNQGRPMNPYGASRPSYPQQPVQAQTANNDSTTKTIIIVVGIIIAVAIIAGVAIFAISQKPSREVTEPPRTEIVLNFNISNYEDVFEAVESLYRDENGNIPDSKIKEVIKKDYKCIQEFNNTTNTFEDIQINENENYICCTLPDGYTYYHYPNRASQIEDSDGNVVDKEQTTEATNDTPSEEYSTEISQATGNGLSEEFLEKLTSATWYDQRRHDGFTFDFDEEGDVTIEYSGAKIEPETQKTTYKVISENEIEFAFTSDGFTETFNVMYSDKNNALPYTIDGEEVMDGYLYTSFEESCSARQEYF